MIINNTIKTTWNPTTRKHYESKGYIFTNYRDSFEVAILDLPLNSNIKINIKCDYCGRENKRTYCDYNNRRSKFVNKDACKKCIGKKEHEELEQKQKLGLLTIDDKGYWVFKENRLKELELFISKNNSIDNLPNLNNPLYNAIWENEGLYNAVKTIGYSWEEISSASPTNHFKNFANIKKKINRFIQDNNRFPFKNEIIRDLGIQQRDIDFHGGIYDIKRKMNYKDKNDLVDDRGFYNRSLYEFQVAQYLIHNNVTYKREQKPFPKSDKKYLSDFTFYHVDGSITHVEVWGYSENYDEGLSGNYNTIKKGKLRLYNKYNINLVSIEYEDFTNRTYDDIQRTLKRKLGKVISMPLKTIPIEYMQSPSSLEDSEIVEVLRKYSNNRILPSITEIDDLGLNSYIREIRKRYKTYLNFANQFGFKLKTVKYYWDDDLIFEKFKELVNNKNPINKKSIIKHEFGGMVRHITGKIIPYKLKFYESYLNKNNYIHVEDIKFLENVANNKGSNIKNKVTPEQQKLAIEILNKHYSKSNTSN